MTVQLGEQNWNDVRIDGDPQLILGRRKGAREIEGVVVGLHANLFDELRGICWQALQDLIATSPRTYEPNAEVDRDDQHFVLDLDDLPEQPIPTRRRRKASQQTEEEENPDRTAALVRTLRTPGLMQQLDADRLADFNALFYSIAFQQLDDSWVHFIRKANPRSLLKRGRVWTHFAGSLRRTETPDMVIDSTVDVVMNQEQLAGFSAIAIKNLFTDVYLVVRDVPVYLGKITEQLGSEMIISDASRDVLRNAASKKVSFAARLFALQRSLESTKIKPDQVRDVLTTHQIAHDRLLDAHGKFAFEEEAVGLFLDVLEGRLFEDDWTGEPRRADRFSTRALS